MKYFLNIFLLSVFTNSMANQKIQIFDTSIRVNDNCQIEFNYNDTVQTYGFPFSKNGKCEFTTHSGTNIVHTEFINGMYILFIENNIKTQDKCYSEYSAFGISRQNTINVTNRIKKSGSCYQDKEIQSFKYFSKFLKPLTSIR